MNLIDRLEKLGRLVLWLCLAAFLVMVPVGLSAQEKQAALVAERARADARREPVTSSALSVRLLVQSPVL